MSSAQITAILNSVVDSASLVLPFAISSNAPQLVTSPQQHSGLSVLIGVTGDLKGRLVLQTSETVVHQVAERMYGMSISGEMLDSFTGELGNMICGNMATKLSERSVQIDITPPTVLMGHDLRISGFKRAVSLPLTLESTGEISILLIFEE